MAPHFGQGGQRPAHYTIQGELPRNISSANNIPLRRKHGDHEDDQRELSSAVETQRKRDRRERRNKVKVGRSTRSTMTTRRPGCLTGRVAYDHSGDEYDTNTVDGMYERPPRSHQGRSLKERDGGFDEDSRPLQSLSPPDIHQGQIFNTDSAITDSTDIEVDDFADLFGAEPPPPLPPRHPISTRPVQYGPSHDLPFNLHLDATRPVKPATNREAIHMVNSWTQREPKINSPELDDSAQSSSSLPGNKPVASKRPVNTYKGNDPVKRRVQNNLLRRVLADKPPPKPRKNADRMVLKCTGRQEFR